VLGSRQSGKTTLVQALPSLKKRLYLTLDDLDIRPQCLILPSWINSFIVPTTSSIAPVDPSGAGSTNQSRLCSIASANLLPIPGFLMTYCSVPVCRMRDNFILRRPSPFPAVPYCRRMDRRRQKHRLRQRLVPNVLSETQFEGWLDTKGVRIKK
jgi:hypothetical protein